MSIDWVERAESQLSEVRQKQWNDCDKGPVDLLAKGAIELFINPNGLQQHIDALKLFVLKSDYDKAILETLVQFIAKHKKNIAEDGFEKASSFEQFILGNATMIMSKLDREITRIQSKVAVYDIALASRLLSEKASIAPLNERMKATHDIAKALGNITLEQNAIKSAGEAFKIEQYDTERKALRSTLLDAPCKEVALAKNLQLLSDYYGSNQKALDATLVSSLTPLLKGKTPSLTDEPMTLDKGDSVEKKKGPGFFGNNGHKIRKEIRNALGIKNPNKPAIKKVLDPAVKEGLGCVIHNVQNMLASSAYTSEDKKTLAAFKADLDKADRLLVTNEMIEGINQAFNTHEKQLNRIKPGIVDRIKKIFNKLMEIIPHGKCYKLPIKQVDIHMDIGVAYNDKGLKADDIKEVTENELSKPSMK